MEQLEKSKPYQHLREENAFMAIHSAHICASKISLNGISVNFIQN